MTPNKPVYLSDEMFRRTNREPVINKELLLE
jgi:hypothetical protein